MINIIFDINVIFDFSSKRRGSRFLESKQVFEKTKNNNHYNCYLSSSSLNTIEFLKKQQIKDDFPAYTKKQCHFIVSHFIKNLLKDFRLAKTPSYIEIDYENIEDSQIIASAIAIDAQVVTRDKDMLDKYKNITITPQQLLKKIEQQEKKPHAIDFANLKKQYFDLQPQIEKQMDEVLNATAFIMGDKVRELEEELQKFTGAKHAITCSNGTDALLLAMMAMGIQPDDEIITTPFTFIATAETIALMKAKPVFVDIEEDTYNIDATKIEAAITDKTKAIIPVSLYGQPADMDAIQAIADRYNLKVIIDGAQSFGATYKGKTDSNLGDISTTSFFPAKPLGCYGDGGAVFTNNDAYAEKIQMMRVHGQNKRYHHRYIGMGGRMDTLQCAIVNVKLKYYEKDLVLRQKVATKYTQTLGRMALTSLKEKPFILPYLSKSTTSAWAQYSIRVKNRETVQAKLKKAGIPTAVHYPMPLHLQECFEYLEYKKGDFPISERISDEIMSLPMNPNVSDDEIKQISKNLG
jgi:UDP-2-acetamido-2-deoxy-ribo-hexuluronate aminotransferase